MARVAATAARAHAEHHFSERIRLQARVHVLEAGLAHREEELRIKDARMERIDPQRRPHYPPAERLGILELRAACGWSQEETARRFQIAVAVDHFSRRGLGKETFKKEPSEADVEKFLDRTSRKVGARPDHMITDHGPQFTADGFDAWLRRREIKHRLGAVGKYGSIAVIERFIKSLKAECTRLLPIVPLAQAAFGRELDAYIDWYNAERPHTRFDGWTPDEVYFNRFPACRKPRYEPREHWPRRSRCAGVQAPIRGKPGAKLELSVTHLDGRKHLPVVSLRRVA